MSIIASLLSLLLLLLVGGFTLASFVFWIWMLVHAITNKALTDTEKIVWVIVIVFTHFIGALIYFFVGRPKALPA